MSDSCSALLSPGAHRPPSAVSQRLCPLFVRTNGPPVGPSVCACAHARPCTGSLRSLAFLLSGLRCVARMLVRMPLARVVCTRMRRPYFKLSAGWSSGKQARGARCRVTLLPPQRRATCAEAFRSRHPDSCACESAAPDPEPRAPGASADVLSAAARQANTEYIER